MGWKEMLRDYLSFTRRDRIAILVILLIILAVYFLPLFISSRTTPAVEPIDTTWITALKKLEQRESASNQNNRYTTAANDPSASNRFNTVHNNPSASRGELFYFDPNTLQAEGWKKLGLREKTIGTILKFRSKGGRFRKPEDLRKIYGLFSDEYERLAPFISIMTEQKKPAETVADVARIKPLKNYTSRYSVIDINLGDTSAFISLPGIGSKLAARIVNFREKLGGFHSIDQVGETFGLPDSTFQMIRRYLKLENAAVKKININTATEDEMKAHPYIRYVLARPIIAYRKENGLFSRLEDIMKVMAVTETTYKKIAPYLTL